MPLYQPRASHAWTEAIADRFMRATGHQVKINEAGATGPVGELGSAIAQRLMGTQNTRITTKTDVPIFSLCHELVHACQNTFKTLQEPLTIDGSRNAIGSMNNSARGALQYIHDFYMAFSKNLFTHERKLPSKMPEILRNLETGWSKLPKDERQQILMYYLQECQAQGIPLEPLKAFLKPQLWDTEKQAFHKLRQFLKALIDTETKLGQNKGFKSPV
jgi:hypothetical protein